MSATYLSIQSQKICQNQLPDYNTSLIACLIKYIILQGTRLDQVDILSTHKRPNSQLSQLNLFKMLQNMMPIYCQDKFYSINIHKLTFLLSYRNKLKYNQKRIKILKNLDNKQIQKNLFQFQKVSFVNKKHRKIRDLQIIISKKAQKIIRQQIKRQEIVFFKVNENERCHFDFNILIVAINFQFNNFILISQVSTMKRHFFLAVILFFIFAKVQVSIIYNHNPKGNTLQNFDVIVIGAGMAGMTAANELAKNGSNVLVLEANQYIGGRMNSTPVTLMDGSIFNFQNGANWIHGNSRNNPLNSLSKKVPNVTLIMTDDQNTVTYNQNGTQVDDQVDQEWDIYSNIIDQIDQYQNTSVYDAINKIDPTKVTNQIFMYTVSNDIEFQTSSSITDLSAVWGQDDTTFPGDDYLVTSRYQAFVQYLSKQDKIQVFLNYKVNKIFYNINDSSSTVYCQNGKQFSAKKIIIAVPIGVLKQGTINFVPDLPNWKKSAIQKLHMGNVCKILIVPNKKLNITDSQHYIGVVSSNVNERGSATYFLNIASLAKIPAYMTFGLGPNADELQNMPQESLKELIASKMSIFAQDNVSSSDFDILRSSWRSNPNFGGTYTYSSITSTPQDWSSMAQPIFENGWYFCGEHTSSKYRGTVHGAYLTGKHTAQYIMSNANSSTWIYSVDLD